MTADSRRQPPLGTRADQPCLSRGFCLRGLQSARETHQTLDDTISYKHWKLSGVQGGTDRKRFLRAARLEGSPKKHLKKHFTPQEAFYIWYCKFLCYFLHTSPLLPPLLPHIHRSVLYVCSSIAALRINSSVLLL